LSTTSLRFVPSTDEAFREHVERMSARQTFRDPADLADRLRILFPRVVVRASEVSGQAHIWYVYRDGVWRSSEDDRWWEAPRSPRVMVTKDGWIEEANAPARALLGLTPSDALPRFVTDFVAPGTLQDATDLFAVVAAGHELAVTTLVRPTSGEVIACDLRVWTEGERLCGAFRLADDIPVQAATVPPPTAALACEPASDVLFAAYAAEAIARMPEATPDGLAIRLRRLYPHAHVEPGNATWTVYRDAPGVAQPTDEWWTASDLPTVRYDAQGLIFQANASAEDVLGRELVGRHWQELVTAGTTDQVAAVLRLIGEVGWAVSRFRMPSPDGSLFEFDSYTKVSGETFVTIMRPRTDDPVGAGRHDRATR
jgi:PAS domain-containing protein